MTLHIRAGLTSDRIHTICLRGDDSNGQLHLRLQKKFEVPVRCQRLVNEDPNHPNVWLGTLNFTVAAAMVCLGAVNNCVNVTLLCDTSEAVTRLRTAFFIDTRLQSLSDLAVVGSKDAAAREAICNFMQRYATDQLPLRFYQCATVLSKVVNALLSTSDNDTIDCLQQRWMGSLYNEVKVALLEQAIEMNNVDLIGRILLGRSERDQSSLCWLQSRNQMLWSLSGWHFNRALLSSIAKNHVEATKVLLSTLSEWQVDRRLDYNGNTALMHAVWYNSTDVAKQLLRAKTDVRNKKNAWGESVFSMAKRRGHWEMVKILETTC